jgi:hypothetical protein
MFNLIMILKFLFCVSRGAIEHLISFLLFHVSMCITEKELER